jgi:hypothetical protein
MEEKIIPSSILYNKENNTNIEYLCFTYYNVNNNKNEKNNGNNNNRNNNHQVSLFDKIDKEIKLEFCTFKSLHLYVNKERITDNTKIKIYSELFKWFSNKKKIHVFENDIIFHEMLFSIKQYNKELYRFIIDILNNKKRNYDNNQNNDDDDEEMIEEKEENQQQDQNDDKKENSTTNSDYTIQSKEIYENENHLVTFKFRFIIIKNTIHNRNNYLIKLSIY